MWNPVVVRQCGGKEWRWKRREIEEKGERGGEGRRGGGEGADLGTARWMGGKEEEFVYHGRTDFT